MRSEALLDPATQKAGQNTLNPHRWVELYADYLFAYALTRLNDEEIARDLVQETFLSALEKVHHFRGESTERTWLTAIIKHKVIDLYRRKTGKLNKMRLTGDIGNEEEFFDPELNNWKKEHWPAPLGIEDRDPLANKELTSILQKCMQKLPSLWLSVFTMKHIDDEMTDTICKQLRITSSNFWVIIHRTKVNLRSCLQKNWI